MRVFPWMARQGAVLAMVVSASCAAAIAPAAPIVTPDGVRFRFVQPGARGVAVAGTFNGWSVSSQPMTQATAGGPWEVVIALPPGEHLFMYVVDGTEWVSPPDAEGYADDGFGSRNGVVVVRSGER